MHIITVSVTVSLITAFNDFKEDFVNRIREKKRFSERQYFFGVGPVLGG